MARAVNEYLQTVCPTLYANAALDVYTELATDSTSATFFGDKFTNWAIALLAAHMFTIDHDRPEGESGLVTAKGEGSANIHYLHNMNKESRTDLGMTHYGVRLLSLIHRMGPVASVGTTAIDLDAGVAGYSDEDFI
jgi:hypothetical protein